MRERILGFVLFLAVCLWRATLRIRLVERERRDAVQRQGKPALHAIWHQRMVLGILTHGFRGCVTMASRSRDGDVIAGFLRFWGFRVVRGSSSRGGGEAMAEMARLLKGTNGWAALTPDGPRGPARRSKPGIAFLAEAVDAPAVPVGTSSSRPLFLRSWDRYLVPRPFSRCVVFFAEPLARGEGETEVDFLARLDRALDAATDEADRLCGVTNAPRAKEGA